MMKHKYKPIDRDTLTYLRLLYEKGYCAYYVDQVSRKNKKIKSPFSLISLIKQSNWNRCVVRVCQKNFDLNQIDFRERNDFNDKAKYEHLQVGVILFSLENNLIYLTAHSQNRNMRNELNDLFKEAKVFNMLDFFTY